MSVTEFMSFVQAISFVKDHYAKDFIEKSVDFFVSIENITEEMRCDLFLALKVMIRHYFKNDREKLWRLLGMAIKALHNPGTDFSVGSIYPDKLELMRGQLIEKDNEVADLKNTVNNQNKIIKELREELEQSNENKPN